MAWKSVKIMGVLAVAGLVGVVAATGRFLPLTTPPVMRANTRQGPPATEITEPFVWTAKDFDVKALGWRNVSVSGGTVATHSSVSVVGSECILKLTTDATHETLQGSGEAGYEITWTSSTPPTGPVRLLVTHGIGSEGTAGFIETNPPSVLGRINISTYQHEGKWGTNLEDYYHEVTLTQGSDGRYAATVWLPTASFQVERAGNGVGAAAEFSIAVEPVGAPTMPSTEAR